MNVYDYLKHVTGEDNFYLRSLNLNFEDGKVEECINVYRDLDKELRDNKDGYRTLFEDDNWRSHLIAYTCAVCSDNDSLVPIIKQRFEKGSMISPQLAVALFRLDKDACLSYFTWYINNLAHSNKSSSIGAIIGVLSAKVIEVDLPSMKINPDSFALGLSVARAHLVFWMDNLV